MEKTEQLIINNFKLLTKEKQIKLLEDLNILVNKKSRKKLKPESFINQINEEIRNAKNGDYESRDINNSTLNLIIDKLFLEEKSFLSRKCNDNFYSDYLIEVFESGTGLDV